MSDKIHHRYPEIDAWRGLAVLGMVLQHSIEIGLFFHTGNPGYVYTDVWIEVVRAIGRVSALSFLLLVGMSGYLSYIRRENRGAEWIDQYKHFLFRGGFIFSWGMVITLISWWLLPAGYIRFGILHLIGVAVVLLPLVMQTWVRRVLLIATLTVTQLLPQFQPATQAWIVLGRYPAAFASLDHWPIVPWLAVVLVGVELGRWGYPLGQRRSLALLEILVRAACSGRTLIWMGQHALLIYLTHVPLLAAFWYLAMIITSEG